MKQSKSAFRPVAKVVLAVSGLHSRQWRMTFFWLWLIPVLLSACTTTTGDRVILKKAEVAKIRNLGVVVQMENGFTVRYSRDQKNAGMAAFGGLFGAAMEGSSQASADQARTDKLKPALGDFNPQQLIADQLVQKLQAANLFNKVETIDSRNANDASKLFKSTELDGLLTVTIHQWGMSSCPQIKVTEKVQVGFDMRVKMLKAKQSKPVWNRNDFYLSGDCYTIYELASQSGLLRNELTRAIDDLTGKIVNTIRFPQ